MHAFAIGASFITTGLDAYILKPKQRVVPFISPIQSLRNVGINKFSIVRLFQGWISSHVIYRAETRLYLIVLVKHTTAPYVYNCNSLY